MKKLLLTLALVLLPSMAWAQCNGIFQPNTVCGNNTGSPALPTQTPITTFPASPGGTNGQVQYNNSGTLGGLTNAQLTALVQQFNSATSGAVPASGGGTTTFLRADGTFALPVYAVNAANYGAKCDGSTNDITAFNNAATAAVSLGAEIILPGGTCILNSTWTLPGTGMKIRGQGIFLTTISCAQNVSPCISSIQPQGPHLSDFGITDPNGLSGSLTAAGTAYTNGTYTSVNLTGGSGHGVRATVTVAGGVVTTVVITFGGVGYVNGNVLGIPALGGTGSGGTWTASGSSTQTNAIVIGDATHSVNYADISRVLFLSASYALTLNNVGTSYIHNNWFQDFATGGILIQSPLNTDGGDSLVDGNWIGGFANGPTSICIQHLSGGGWKFANNKMISCQAGYLFQGTFTGSAGSTVTSDIQLTGNSIEGCGVGGQACIIINNPSGANGNLVHVIISSNEIGGGGASALGIILGINSGTPRQWISDVNIIGNFIIGVSGGSSCITVQGTQTFNITGNTCDDTGTPVAGGIVTATTSFQGTVSANSFGANFPASSKYSLSGLGNHVVLHDTSGLTVSALPATADVGSTATVTDGSPGTNPCTGSSNGTLGVRVAAGWKCM